MSRNHRRLNKKLWAHCRFLAFTRDKFRCVRCGRAGKLEGHHKVSLSEAPLAAYDPANVTTYCRDCHIELSLFPQRREWVTHIHRAYKELHQ